MLFREIVVVHCGSHTKHTNILSEKTAEFVMLKQVLLSSRLLSKNIKIRIYKNIILPVVLYGCETWSLTLREEDRLRVFEKRVLRGIFGP
jgi:hypothetical protein